MAQPPYQDPNYQYPPQDPYGQNPGTPQYPPQNTPYAAQQPGYPPTASPPSPPPGPPAGGGPKKRQYAAQAFEFGSGANAAITPLAAGGVGGASYPPGGMTGPAGYPAESFTPAPVGYTPPQPGYESPGVAAMTNQFGQMGVGGQPQQAAPQLQVC